MDYLLPLTHWHWFIGALVLGILELLLPGVVFLWMGLAAACVGFLVLAQPDIVIEYQVIAFTLLSIIIVVAARFLISKKEKPTDHPTLNQRSQQFIGQHYLLQADSINKSGKVKIGDSLWNVVLNQDMKAGDAVLIESADGLTLKGTAVSDDT